MNVEMYIVSCYQTFSRDHSTTFVQSFTMFITFPQVLDRGVMEVGHVVVAVDEGIPVDIGDVTEVIQKYQRETLQVQLAQWWQLWGHAQVSLTHKSQAAMYVHHIVIQQNRMMDCLKINYWIALTSSHFCFSSWQLRWLQYLVLCLLFDWPGKWYAEDYFNAEL